MQCSSSTRGPAYALPRKVSEGVPQLPNVSDTSINNTNKRVRVRVRARVRACACACACAYVILFYLPLSSLAEDL